MTEQKTKEEQLQEVGRCALGSIREMVAALNCDYERLEELRAEREDLAAACENDGPEDTNIPGKIDELAAWDAENSEDLQELTEAAGDCEDRDDAEQRIQEDPLSIEYRSGWVTDKNDMQAEEARILLTTGGPAVQIIVELDNREPHRACLQVQDWFTPWTDYYEEGIGEVLMSYVRVFCFE